MPSKVVSTCSGIAELPATRLVGPRAGLRASVLLPARRTSPVTRQSRGCVLGFFCFLIFEFFVFWFWFWFWFCVCVDFFFFFGFILGFWGCFSFDCETYTEPFFFLFIVKYTQR